MHGSILIVRHEVSEGVILNSTNLILVSIHGFLFFLPQTDLEMVVEDLAQKVNRPYLRTPCHKIISAARLVQQKRQEFLASVARGVAPNDSPEPPRRKYKLHHFYFQYQVCCCETFFHSCLCFSYPGGSWDWEYLGFASPEV